MCFALGPFDVGSPEWMTGSIAAAAFEEVCLLGVSWTPGSQGAAVFEWGQSWVVFEARFAHGSTQKNWKSFQ